MKAISMPEGFGKGRLKLNMEIIQLIVALSLISMGIENHWVIPSQRWPGVLSEGQLHAETKQKVRLLLHRE